MNASLVNAGRVFVQPQSPGASLEGDFWWDSVNNILYIYSEGAWQVAGSGAGGGVDSIVAGTNISIDPVAGTGDVTINLDGDFLENPSPYDVTSKFEWQADGSLKLFIKGVEAQHWQ